MHYSDFFLHAYQNVSGASAPRIGKMICNEKVMLKLQQLLLHFKSMPQLLLSFPRILYRLHRSCGVMIRGADIMTVKKRWHRDNASKYWARGGCQAGIVNHGDITRCLVPWGRANSGQHQRHLVTGTLSRRVTLSVSVTRDP